MTAPLTPARLSEIRARAESATKLRAIRDDPYSGGPYARDEYLVAAAKSSQDVPDLLAEVDRLLTERALSNQMAEENYALYQTLEKRVAAQDRLLMENDEDVAMAYWEDSQKAEAEVDRLTAALASERAKTAAAETTIAQVPHGNKCHQLYATSHPCTCWKSHASIAAFDTALTEARAEVLEEAADELRNGHQADKPTDVRRGASDWLNARARRIREAQK